jgi:CRP/FNR family transcriptional regulator, cyclic AMP receptor protein
MVHQGRVEIRKQIGGEERLLGTLAKGELLGHIALFRNAPRSASAIAADAVTLMVIPANRLETLVRANPALAVALIRDLAAMMLRAEDRLREVEERQPKQ